MRNPKPSVIVPITFAKNPDSFIESLMLLSKSPNDPVAPITGPIKSTILPVNFAIPATTSLMIVTPISMTANNPLKVDLSFS